MFGNFYVEMTKLIEFGNLIYTTFKKSYNLSIGYVHIIFNSLNKKINLITSYETMENLSNDKFSFLQTVVIKSIALSTSRDEIYLSTN